MSKRHTTQLLTAPAGTGKSYMATYSVVHDFLPGSSGRVFTNMPFGLVPDGHKPPPQFPGETFADRIGEFVARKYGGDAKQISERIELIPVDVLKSWMETRRGFSGPWEYFQGVELSNDLLIIDEAHNFCGATHGREKKRLWMEFCGELRHRGNSAIQLITQSPSKLAKEILNEAGLRQALVDAEEERDPWFGIQMLYWYELQAKITGTYRSCFVRIDLRDIDGKKTKNHVVRVPRLQEIFALYDSHNATSKGESGGAGHTLRQYEKRSWPSFLFWFIGRNFSRFLRPVAVIALIFSLLFYGGSMFSLFTGFIGSSMAPKKSPASVRKEIVAKRPPSAVPVARPQASTFVPGAQRSVDAVVADSVALPDWVLRVVTPDSATFNDGVTLKLNDTIDGGQFDGYAISKIDFAKRTVFVRSLDDLSERFVLGRVHNAEAVEDTAAVTSASAGGSSTSSVRQR